MKAVKVKIVSDVRPAPSPPSPPSLCLSFPPLSLTPSSSWCDPGVLLESVI
jgi:hypothetical protein